MNYVQAIPAASPNAYADGEKVFITLAAIKLAKTEDELTFLIGHELLIIFFIIIIEMGAKQII